jgi:hypothetical protein
MPRSFSRRLGVGNDGYAASRERAGSMSMLEAFDATRIVRRGRAAGAYAQGGVPVLGLPFRAWSGYAPAFNLRSSISSSKEASLQVFPLTTHTCLASLLDAGNQANAGFLLDGQLRAREDGAIRICPVEQQPRDAEAPPANFRSSNPFGRGARLSGGSVPCWRFAMKACACMFLSILALVLVGLLGALCAEPDATPTTRDVDLVVCLDTSNSMDGLIGAAKQKLWDLVNTLSRGQPTPHLRVALYSYGNDSYDAKAGWVRKELDFTTDLDHVFKKLFDLKTGGGTEYVARVCRDAVRDLAWSRQRDALKLIFVCGNEPATQDRTLALADVAALATKEGIVINPIYCGGGHDPAAAGWRELGTLAKGRFANIDQGQNVAVATPFDHKLAELANEVNATYVPYGAEGPARLKFQEQQTANSRGLGTANLAGRVVVQNSALYAQQGWDLVDRVKKEKGFDLTKLQDSELPETLRKMPPAERQQYVQDMLKKREAIQQQVDVLARQRQTYLRDEAKKAAATTLRRFDAVLEQTIRTQAAEKKIVIPE